MALRVHTDVQALTDESVRYLQDLLRIDTTNPPGNEIHAVRYLAEVLRGAEYEPLILESLPGRGNLIVRYRGTGELKPLLLYGHVDVVMAESQHWTHAPFSGQLADGCVWGRGAIDMKGMVVQELMVMLLLQRSSARLKRDVIFAATADEEVGGRAGMGYLVEHHPDLIRAEYGLSEGGGTTMYIAGKPFYDIRTAEKGICRFKLRAYGDPGHGSVPRPETSISKIAQAVLKLSTAPLPFRSTATVAALFELLGASLGVPRDRRQFTEQNFQRFLQVLPADFGQYLHAITHDTAVPTGLRAGHKINVIPGQAEAVVDGRYLPGQTPEGFLAEVRHVVGDGYEIEPTDHLSSPLEDMPGGPLYDTIVSVVGRYAPKATVLPIMLAGATDAERVSRLGTRCLGFSPLRVSEGFPIEQLVHGHDERIPIEGYVWGIQVLYDIVTEFCAG
jgi:acetylornithine deacetylase/succinyl-diaminopimelate desuccinylase-like protein